jgi:FAD:protein FMN transferase
MGTTWRADFVAPEPSAVARIKARCEAVLCALVNEMSQWEEDSDLSRFNRLGPGEWMTLPPSFSAVVAEALRIAEWTGGAFDPTIGAASELWGFGAQAIPALPDAESVEASRRRIGWHLLAFASELSRLRQPGGVMLDLSAIAKGYAVDRVLEEISRQGIHSCLVEVGGELRAQGVKPDGQPWWVGMEDVDGLAAAPLRIALSGWAVATSSNARRYHDVGGIRLGHTLSPRDGRPVATSALAVSVIDESAMRSDALATALMVMGPDAVQFAQAHAIPARIVLNSRDGPVEYLSSALQGML